MTKPEELEIARRRFPLGDHVTGRVSHVPKPGAIGLFVDLGDPPEGFVDVITLPRSAERWPQVGTVTAFEVIQHRTGQVRLWPLESCFRDDEQRRHGRTEQEWLAAKARYPLGAGVTAVYANRECDVSFGSELGSVEWDGALPHIGDVSELLVHRHLESVRVLLLRQSSEQATQ